jgi:hypothetical protein
VPAHTEASNRAHLKMQETTSPEFDCVTSVSFLPFHYVYREEKNLIKFVRVLLMELSWLVYGGRGGLGGHRSPVHCAEKEISCEGDLRFSPGL